MVHFSNDSDILVDWRVKLDQITELFKHIGSTYGILVDLMVNVGKYARSMHPMGKLIPKAD